MTFHLLLPLLANFLLEIRLQYPSVATSLRIKVAVVHTWPTSQPQFYFFIGLTPSRKSFDTMSWKPSIYGFSRCYSKYYHRSWLLDILFYIIVFFYEQKMIIITVFFFIFSFFLYFFFFWVLFARRKYTLLLEVARIQYYWSWFGFSLGSFQAFYVDSLEFNMLKVIVEDELFERIRDGKTPKRARDTFTSICW